MQWDQASLEGLGFTGFVPFEKLPSVDVPRGAGVYLVFRTARTAPGFLDRSVAGWFKGKDPTVGKGELQAAWVKGAHVLYIGSAPESLKGNRGLRKRLDEFHRFGAGGAVGHVGGKYIWQLADHGRLLVAWRPTPDHNPDCVESQLIQLFKADHGMLPFANRKLGKRTSCAVDWLPDLTQA
ncbi:hypothetical protein [Arsenicicoccus dermatophilus]|uniref:hypothetical protein n=1 Tax=Arsenicicoccus dermatophilus TaxID=1076331 RepID=UPI003916F736